MNSRRSFFSRCAAFVAAVAIAPEIAFRTKLALPEAKEQMLVYAVNMNGIYDNLIKCGEFAESDGEQKPPFDEIFRVAYEMKKARKRMHITEDYFIVTY